MTIDEAIKTFRSRKALAWAGYGTNAVYILEEQEK